MTLISKVKREIGSKVQRTIADFHYRHFYWEILLRFKTAAKCTDTSWNGKSLYSYKHSRMEMLDQTKISFSLISHRNLQKASKKRASTYRDTKRQGSSLVLRSNEGLGRLREGPASASRPSRCSPSLIWVSLRVPTLCLGSTCRNFKALGRVKGKKKEKKAGSLGVMRNFLVVKELVSHLLKGQNCIPWHPMFCGKSVPP